MGYRYKHGGYAPRMYVASVEIDGLVKTLRYSSVWAKNSWANFCDLKRRVEIVFGKVIKRVDVLSVELYADALWRCEV